MDNLFTKKVPLYFETDRFGGYEASWAGRYVSDAD